MHLIPIRMTQKPLFAAAASLICLGWSLAAVALPPPPVPKENPTTEAKRLLGKALFWDEQLSSDNTVACGSCHQPRYGGGDGRRARGPGPDGKVGTADDVFGSPGVVRMGRNGVHVKDKVFGDGPRVGTRAAPSYFTGIWNKTSFWDGRAGPEFKDPVTGKVEIADGGALENQAIGPLFNDAEMAHEKRQWPELLGKLKQAKPLALARKLPPDLAVGVKGKTYPELFAKAFGDGTITPTRIAFAIASYERTLIADQTPWDLDQAGIKPLSEEAKAGKVWFEYHKCDQCHKPPMFADDSFKAIGLRPAFHDIGRKEVTGEREDAGRMHIPSLRNIVLRTSFMHTGEFTNLDEVLDLYAQTARGERDTLPDGSDYTPRTNEVDRAGIKAFLTDALVDPRVKNETFPFDRPQLRSERIPANQPVPGKPGALKTSLSKDGVRLSWKAPAGGAEDYAILRNGDAVGFATDTTFTDEGAKPGMFYLYQVAARNTAAKASGTATAVGMTQFAWLWPVGVLALAGGGAAFFRRRRGA
jgi:cytochrome c peroxidase